MSFTSPFSEFLIKELMCTDGIFKKVVVILSVKAYILLSCIISQYIEIK